VSKAGRALPWHPVAFCRARDPGWRALKRSVRAALVLPAAFAIARALTGDIQVPLFTSFGTFALLLLVELDGTRAARLRGYTALIGTAIPLIVAGTLCSRSDGPAIAGMAVAGFAVLFAGLLAPQAALASMYLLLAFVLPVSVPAGPDEILPRLAGWGIGSVLGLAALMVLWPPAWHDERRAALAEAAGRLATLAQAHAEGRGDHAARVESTAAIARLRGLFEATPYPCTGTGATDIALARMLSRTEWAGDLGIIPPNQQSASLRPGYARLVYGAAARTLRAVAVLASGADPAAVAELRVAVTGLHQARVASLAPSAHDVVRLVTARDDPAARGTGDFLPYAMAALTVVHRARAFGLACEELGILALESAGAGRAPGGGTAVTGAAAPAAGLPPWRATLRETARRAASYWTPRSVWLRNSVRGAAGLALAVAVARIAGVQHAFWVAFGAMSVLRSNALGTGARALRAVAGTVVGFAAGTAIMIGVGAHVAVLWFVLPVAVLVAGAAPAVISFAAGQAGFTVMVIVLFNILVPTGWTVGLVRVEDVALGCAVSVAVGLLLWPRGASTALGGALRDAYAASAGYLTAAVARFCSPGLDPGGIQRDGQAALAADARLDDAYRQYLSERGAKAIGLRTATHLRTGAARLRLEAHSLATMPAQPLDLAGVPAVAGSAAAEVTQAAADLRLACERVRECFAGDCSGALNGSGSGPPQWQRSLVRAFGVARAEQDEAWVRIALRVSWAGEYLADEQALQREFAAAVDALDGSRRPG
jgi:uncharacterized membrane protein YccC